MTIAAYFEQKARREREKNIARGRVEGRVEGRAEERAEWLAWDARRREAEARGEAFDQPVPSSEGVASHNS